MKSYHVIIEPEAQEDLANIYAYIKEVDTVVQARRFLLRLQESIESLNFIPQRCRKSHYIDDENTHDMIVCGYTICYTIQEDRVHIVALFRQRAY